MSSCDQKTNDCCSCREAATMQLLIYKFETARQTSRIFSRRAYLGFQQQARVINTDLYSKGAHSVTTMTTPSLSGTKMVNILSSCCGENVTTC